MAAPSLLSGAGLGCMYCIFGELPVLLAVLFPFILFIVILPALVPWRAARRWRAAVPAERRRPQFQLLEIICVWFLFSPAIALMAGRGEWLADLLDLRYGSQSALGVALAWYMALGAYAGWAYARFETRGELPRPWRSCLCMALGSVVPPLMATVAVAATVSLAGVLEEGVLGLAWFALMVGTIFWLAARNSRPSAPEVPLHAPGYGWPRTAERKPRFGGSAGGASHL